MTDTPLVKITVLADGTTYLYHLWKDIEKKKSVEISDKPGGGELTRNIPSTLKFAIDAGGLDVRNTIPESRSKYITQNLPTNAVVNYLESLVGSIVRVQTPRILLDRGIVESVTFTDDGKNDDHVAIMVEIKEVVDVDGIRLGTIVVPVISDPGATTGADVDNGFNFEANHSFNGSLPRSGIQLEVSAPCAAVEYTQASVSTNAASGVELLPENVAQWLKKQDLSFGQGNKTIGESARDILVPQNRVGNSKSITITKFRFPGEGSNQKATRLSDELAAARFFRGTA